MAERQVSHAPLWVRLVAAGVRRLPWARYRVLHDFCPRSRPPFWMTLPPESGRLGFLCDLQDTVAREVCFTGQYEPQETMLVRSTLRPGMTFVDVGANWGYYTLLGAHLVGPTGRVVSLEPHPALYAVLRGNIDHNRLDQVTTLQVAAADRPGGVTLNGFDRGNGNFGLSRIDPDAAPERGVSVPARPLDELLSREGLDRVDLMKMDIEGAETLALDGLRRTLAARRVRRLLLELHPALLIGSDRTPRSVLDRLTGYGYRSWRIDHSPEMTRRAAYRRVDDIRVLLEPGGERALDDPWPHLLLTSPGVEPTL